MSDERKLALFQAAFDEIPDVMLLKDANGNFLLCNRALARLYGTTPEAMVALGVEGVAEHIRRIVASVADKAPRRPPVRRRRCQVRPGHPNWCG